MKLLVLCLTLFAAMAIAEGPVELGALHPYETGTVNTDAIVFSQTYSYAALLNGLRHNVAGGGIADDFILSSAASIQNIRFWIVYTSGSAPTSYDLVISQDNGDSDPNTATTVWNENVPCTVVDTGDTNWGFIIWEITCAIPMDAYPSLSAGPRYWLEIVFSNPSPTDYVLVEAPVFGQLCYTGGVPDWARCDTWTDPCDVFFELYDTPVALDRSTWADIKTIF